MSWLWFYFGVIGGLSSATQSPSSTPTVNNLPQYYTSTIAGTVGLIGPTDGIGPAARLDDPVDGIVNGTHLFFTTRDEAQIRRMDLDSAEVTTVVGDTSSGYQDGTLLTCRFSKPSGMDWVDMNKKKVWVADSQNRVIRMVDFLAGDVVTELGTKMGSAKLDGVGRDARFESPQKILVSSDYSFAYVSDTYSVRRVNKTTLDVITIAGTDSMDKNDIQDGTGTDAHFDTLQDLVLYNGALYISARDDGVIRRINTTSHEVTTVVGTGTSGNVDGIGTNAQLNTPTALCLSPWDGSAYTTGRESNDVRKINLNTYEVTTVVGTTGVQGGIDGVGTNVQLWRPKMCYINPTTARFIIGAKYSLVRVWLHLPTQSPTATRNPVTVTPTTISPATQSPITVAPTSRNPSSISPLTNSPTSYNPTSFSPTSRSPSTDSPTSYSPNTASPITGVPTTASPVTQSPLTSNPTTRNPSTLSPATCSPMTVGPATGSPSSQSPLTQAPTSSQPTTSEPITAHPTTASPQTQCPTTAQPTSVSPTTKSPSLSILGVTWDERPKRLAESRPWWSNDADGPMTDPDVNIEARFFVQNQPPPSSPNQELSVSCVPQDDRMLVNPEQYDMNGVSTKLDQGEWVHLGASDPVNYTCPVVFPNGSRSILCEGGFVAYSSGSALATTCNKASLVSSNAVDDEFCCPYGCWEGLTGTEHGCPPTEQTHRRKSFVVQARTDTETTSSTSQGLIVCRVARKDSSLSSAFALRFTIEEVAWPLFDNVYYWIGNETRVIGRSGDGPLVLTTSTSTRMVVSSSAIFDAAAWPRVWVGAQEASILAVTPYNITFITPSYSAVCGDADECGYHALRIKNPARMSTGGQPGGMVKCPPACPGGGLGIFYTPQCVGYLPPERCSQLDPSDQGQCAYGSRDACRPCAEHAFCPGGRRVWPMPGYWSAAESSFRIVKCPAPAKERCRGWDPAQSEADCGEGYTGVMCSSCADGYYDSMGVCEVCPDETDEQVAKLVGLLAACAGLAILTIIVLTVAHRGLERRYWGLLWWNIKDLLAWSLVSLQVYSLVFTSAAGLEPTVRDMFAWLNVLQLDFQAVGPECFSDPSEAFWREYAVFAISIIGCLMALLLNTKILRWVSAIDLGMLDSVGEKTYTLLIALYSPVTFLAFSTVHCTRSADANGNTVWVAWANNQFTCYGREHGRAAAFGLVALCAHSVVFPISTFLQARRVFRMGDGAASIRSQAKQVQKMELKRYKLFFGDDYYSNYYWFLHAHFGLVFVLCATSVFLSANDYQVQVAKLTLNLFVLALALAGNLMLRPFVQHVAWKLPVRCLLLFCVLLASVLNYLVFLLDEGGVNRHSVTSLSYVVLTVALVNFVVLVAASYYVMVHLDPREYGEAHYFRWYFTGKSHGKLHRLNTVRQLMASSKTLQTKVRDGSSKGAGGSFAITSGSATLASATDSATRHRLGLVSLHRRSQTGDTANLHQRNAKVKWANRAKSTVRISTVSLRQHACDFDTKTPLPRSPTPTFGHVDSARANSPCSAMSPGHVSTENDDDEKSPRDQPLAEHGRLDPPVRSPSPLLDDRNTLNPCALQTSLTERKNGTAAVAVGVRGGCTPPPTHMFHRKGGI